MSRNLISNNSRNSCIEVQDNSKVSLKKIDMVYNATTALNYVTPVSCDSSEIIFTGDYDSSSINSPNCINSIWVENGGIVRGSRIIKNKPYNLTPNTWVISGAGTGGYIGV